MLRPVSAIAFLSCLCLTRTAQQVGKSFNLTTHSNLTLHPQTKGTSKQEWRLGRDTKIAMWEKGYGYSYPSGPFKGRVEMNETSVTLFDLRPNDSAILTYFAEDSSGTESEYPYAISVRDPLRPPILRLMTNNSRPRTDNRMSLQCIALDNDTSITYAWYTDTLESGDNIREVTVRTDSEDPRISRSFPPTPLEPAAPYGADMTTVFLAILALILLSVIGGYALRARFYL
ncbi:ORF11 [Fowl adenovirus 8a]|uniref:ORF11 n=1 Tax=Fowl adenovirus 8a TaxID=586028 RepID=A0A191UM05_9ADEN|nr:ORF11 [Fowl adenovirus 8a]